MTALEDLHYLLMKSNALFLREISSEARKIGLTSGQPKILDFLLKYEEADQKTIASYCEIEQATVGSILLRMENSGLIQRRQKDGNRRSLYVSLTNSGKDAAMLLADIFQKVETKATAALSEQEIKTLHILLEKICATMQTV